MFITKLTPAFVDTDGLGHINNTKLPIWFELGRNDIFRIFTPDLDLKKWELIIAKIEVEFKGELFYGADIEIRTFVERIGTSSFVVFQEAWQNGNLGAQGRATMVHYDFAAKTSVALSAEHKQKLQEHLLNSE